MPTHLVSASDELRAFAVRNADGGLQVCLINKHDQSSIQVAIDTGRAFAAASMISLSGPAPTATSGVRLGGAPINEFGAWSPTRRQVSLAGSQLTVDVPAASAQLIALTA